mgnify:CR=1 FL=1
MFPTSVEPVNEIFLTNGTHKLTVTGTGLTSGFSANVNAALVTAAETSWTNAAVPVSKSPGLVFTSIALGTI